MARSESLWLDVRAGLDELVLQEYHRPYAAFNAFPDREEQQPQMITLIGQRAKSLAMRKLQFGSGSQGNISGQVHLRADLGTVDADSPVLFAECELHTSIKFEKIVARPPGDIIQRPLKWHNRVPQGVDPITMANLIYAKLISPFSTVICLFVEDFGGTNAVARTLANWLVALSNRPSDLPMSAHPRVLILTPWDELHEFDEKSATRSFMLELAKEIEKKTGQRAGPLSGKLSKAKMDHLLSQQFGNLRVLALPSPVTPTRGWGCIKSRILQDSQDVHIQRRSALVAFSALHLKAFFHMAFDHFSNDIVSPFSFIRASRIPNPVPRYLTEHVGSFMKRIQAPQIFQFAIPIVASALALEAYPPGMHAFHPSAVFQEFYGNLCQSACINMTDQQRVDDVVSSLQLSSRIDALFCQRGLDLINGDTDSISSHKATLINFREVWKELRSNETCYSCLARRPESTLPCGHSLCEPCTILYGQSSIAEPCTFHINACPLCGNTEAATFKLKPATANVRVLSIDGGGIRGIVALRFMKELQNTLKLPMPVQEHFDLAVGSSSGGLILLGLYFNSWSVDECTGQFQHLAQLAFRRRRFCGLPAFNSPLLQRAQDLFYSMATGSRYGSGGVETAMKEAFGDKKSFFECSSSGAKVAVTATTTKDSTTCLITNYNGPKHRSKTGYKTLRPKDRAEEILVWQAARVTSAAPPFFKALHGYQDGGLGGHNNPVKLALWEQDFLWTRKNKQPDLVLSLGTGFQQIEDSLPDEQRRETSVSSDWFVPRLFRSFMGLLEGEKAWVDLLNSLVPAYKDRYHRMNIAIQGPEPELDNIKAMPGLQRQVKSHVDTTVDVQRCAENIIASLFYLELNQLPMCRRGQFICTGRILCRIGPSSLRALQTLVIRLKEQQSYFHMDFHSAIPCVDRQVYEAVKRGQAYCRPVEFNVASLADAVDIKIDGIIPRARSISNCPYILQTLIDDQGLNLIFGHMNHKRKLASMFVEAKRRRYT